MLDTTLRSAADMQSGQKETPNAKYASWCLFVLFLLASVGLQGADDAAGIAGDGSVIRQLGYIVTCAVTLYVCRGARWTTLAPFSIVLAMGWCWLSVTWAIDPINSLRRLVLTTMLMVTIFAAVDVAGGQRTLKAFAWLTLVVLLFNYASVYGTSGGIHRGGSGDLTLAGNWRGAMGHKNFAGPFTAVTLFFLLLGPRILPNWLRWPAILLAAVFLWRTQSMTSIGLFLLCVPLAFVYTNLGVPGRALLLPIGTLLTVILAIAFAPEIAAAIEATGRYLSQPDAMTGRGEVWSALLQFIGKNWLLGSGYGSLWGIGPNGPIQGIVSANSWVHDVYSGHNGHLDLLGQIGVPGMALSLVAFFVVPLARLSRTRSLPIRTNALLLVILLFSLGHNFTESTLLSRDMILWLMHCLVLALIYTSLRRERASLETTSAEASPAELG